jgi:hypothetical protein
MRAFSARLSRTWFIVSLMSGENARFEEVRPLTEREFRLMLSMVMGALAVFGVLMRVLAA